MRDPALISSLENISAQTMIVWGEADLLTPLEHAAAFSSRIRGSRIAIVEEAGHFPQKEKPQTFLRVVCNFLAGATNQSEERGSPAPYLVIEAVPAI
jgi:pimeloyl-ACP methyl ester carboxylesterase